MKTFTKIFMAVVALFAFACTTDTTFDQTVELGAGQTTITLSLDEESRTHITGKNGEEYPLYWSEGDKIAVNGNTSNALGEASHGQTTATFTVKGEQPRPWNIVYPAPAEGVTAEKAGNYPVTFMASQPYTANTFAEGSTPMYAYVSESANTGLQHLAGVLRFDVKAPAPAEGETEPKTVTLKALVVEVENGKISGNFDVDCANGGTLTPHTDATNTVTVTFPENGLTLSTTATPIYVAVPKGDYGMVTLTLYANDGKIMKGLFDSSAKAIAPGVVREFPEFEFSSNNEPEEGVFLIYDEASLRTFADSINDADAEKVAAFNTAYPNAKVVANIELTKPWVSINGYTGSFDGGNYSISNLDAPLFSTTSATIKNISLQVNINIQEKHWVKTKWGSYYSTTFGALVCTYNGTSISNCSVSGNIEHSTPITQDMNYVISGVVGFCRSKVNYVKIRNSADIKLSAAFSISAKSLQIGGCVGHIYAADGATDCNNSGDITFDKEFSITSTYQFLVGGIAGFHNYVTFNRCNNSGDIDIYGTINVARFTIGGLFGDYRSRALLNATNSGNITFRKDSSARCEGDFSMIGGIAGMALFGSETSEKCINNGTITIEEGASLTSITADKSIRIGGCFAQGQNGSTKSTTNNGKIILSGKFVGELDCGGVVGYNNIGVAEANTDGMTNNGALEITSTASTENLHLGGVIGQSRCALYNLKNNATIEIAGSHKKLYVGGVFGYATSGGSTMGNMVSCKDITINATSVDAEDYYVGGISGNGTITVNIQNLKVFSNITAPNCANAGMVTGTAYSGSIKATNSHVGGSILKAGLTTALPLSLENYTTYIYSSGVELDSDAEKSIINTAGCGWLSESINSSVQYKSIPGVKIGDEADFLAWAATAADSSESVALTADIDLTKVTDWSALGDGVTAWKPIEGFTGRFDGKGFKINGLKAPLFGTTQAAEIKNVHLTGVAITAGGSVVGTLACVIKNTSAVVSNCSVKGTLTIENATKPSKVGTSIGDGVDHDSTNYGGIIGISTSTQTFSNLTSEVNITLQGANFYRSYTAIGISYVAGPLYKVNTLGTINYNVEDDATAVYAGGVAVESISSMTDCNNGSEEDVTHTKGSITLNGTYANTGCFAGLVCVNKGNMTNCHNYGNLTLGGTTANIFFGGCIARAASSSDSSTITVKDCSNNGKMTISGTSGSNRYGGIAAESWGGNYLFDNCHNYGAIEHTSTSTVSSTIIGGVLGYNVHLQMSFNNCSNNGAITLNGAVGDNRVGGFIGYNNKADALTLNSCKNYGSVSVGGSSKNVYVGGFIGLNNKAISSMTGIINEGDVTCTTTTTSSTVFIGGIIARNAAGLINDARCHCTVTAWGYPNVGMVTGSEYAETTKATNCHIGGTIDQGEYGEYTNDDDIEVTGWHSKLLPIRADVYYKAIYSNRDIEAAIAVDNGCGYISAIDAAPVYAEVTEVE